MPSLGKKYTCYSCHTKFYDLGNPTPLCPKCGADQTDADDAPVVTTSRSRRVVEVAPIEDDFEAEPETEEVAADSEDEEDDILVVTPDAEPEEDDDEEEEEY